MKRKGFTLVELLAVIVILAVISIITIPMIGNVIEESKKKALEQSVNGLVESANYFTISNDGVYEFVFDENKKGETIKGDKLEYKGNIEGTGKLYIDKNGDISLCLVDDKYYVYKNYNSGIYVGEVKDNNCIIGYDVLTNKYVAMLDDGTGQISNVYSKDEVNDIVDSLQSQISDNSSNINMLLDAVNSNTTGIENLNSVLSNKVSFPDYSNVLGTITSSGEFTTDENCYIIGYIKSPSSESSYIKYGGSSGRTLIDTNTSNTIVPVMILASKDETFYIRSGATVSLTKYRLK